ncbi:hypothetical protein [Rhodococcus opacus]|jgi:hypothetical protein|uniref:hypothetical protein n=1 Tax=Rhodococcus opacus TaxID=37919 RepID=UPI00217DD909|nr:hypothetical protein [Rhodococcus opacus]
MKLALTQGEGWVTLGLADRECSAEDWWSGVAHAVERFEIFASKMGTPSTSFGRYLDMESRASATTSLEQFRDDVGRAAALGFTDIVTAWPRSDEPFRGDERLLEELAGQLESTRRGTLARLRHAQVHTVGRGVDIGACESGRPHGLAVTSGRAGGSTGLGRRCERGQGLSCITGRRSGACDRGGDVRPATGSGCGNCSSALVFHSRSCVRSTTRAATCAREANPNLASGVAGLEVFDVAVDEY